MKTIGTCLGLTLFGMILGFAQDNFDPLGEEADRELPKIIRVHVEYIEMPHETMTELLQAPRTSANDTPLRAKLQDLVKEGKAKIIETQMATARSGQKATTESIHELIYPVEYDQRQIQHVAPENNQAQASPPIVGPPTPISYETRNTGSTLEIEPTIGEDPKLIDLRLLPTLVYHTGNEIWYEETKGKDTHRIQMPNFYKIQVDTSVTLITGQPFLMAAISPKDVKGAVDFTKKVLIFVRADVVTVGR